MNFIMKFNTECHEIHGAHTFDQYVALPLAERHRRVCYWLTPWYKLPYSMLWTFPQSSEFDKLDAFLKQNYPVQFRVRNILENISHYFCYSFRPLSRVKTFYHNWIIGQRNEMRKAVFTRNYQDIDSMVLEFHRQCLIEFVDREKAFENNDYTRTRQDRVFASALREHYDYATRGRAKLQEQMDAELAKVSTNMTEITADKLSNLYKDYNALEKKLIDQDTKMCNWVVKNRYRLWS